MRILLIQPESYKSGIGFRTVAMSEPLALEMVAAYVGELTAFHAPDEHFFFRREYVDELRAMTPGPITRPDRYFALIAKGDEVLDWREMSARYAGTNLRLLEGSDHALSDFDAHLPHLVRFLRLGD